MWTNVEEKIREKDFTNDKNLIVGHWHAFRVAQLYRGVADYSNIDFNVFIANEDKDIIFTTKVNEINRAISSLILNENKLYSTNEM